MTLAGHNQPPSLIEFSGECVATLGAWLKDNPVVETEEQAKDGKLLVDRARLCLADMESERKQRVIPLQQQVKAIDDEYRSPRTILDKILDELRSRLGDYIRKEEDRRRLEIQAARERAQEAEKTAREAEERERSAVEDARAGVETDIGAATVEADARFNAFQRAQRDLARAERTQGVKISGGFKPALSTRFKEELVAVDPHKALSIMGWSERLLEALIMDAREHRREFGNLPDGIVAQGERRL